MGKPQFARGEAGRPDTNQRPLSSYCTTANEEREDVSAGQSCVPSSYSERLNLHPRILEVSRDLFLDGYP